MQMRFAPVRSESDFDAFQLGAIRYNRGDFDGARRAWESGVVNGSSDAVAALTITTRRTHDAVAYNAWLLRSQAHLFTAEWNGEFAAAAAEFAESSDARLHAWEDGARHGNIECLVATACKRNDVDSLGKAWRTVSALPNCPPKEDFRRLVITAAQSLFAHNQQSGNFVAADIPALLLALEGVGEAQLYVANRACNQGAALGFMSLLPDREPGNLERLHERMLRGAFDQAIPGAAQEFVVLLAKQGNTEGALQVWKNQGIPEAASATLKPYATQIELHLADLMLAKKYSEASDIIDVIAQYDLLRAETLREDFARTRAESKHVRTTQLKRVGVGLGSLLALFALQGIMYSTSSPTGDLRAFAKIATSGSLSDLAKFSPENTSVLPQLPTPLRDALVRPKGTPKISVNGSLWSTQRTATISWPGTPVRMKVDLVSRDSLIHPFARHQWELSTALPRVSVTVDDPLEQNPRWQAFAGEHLLTPSSLKTMSSNRDYFSLPGTVKVHTASFGMYAGSSANVTIDNSWSALIPFTIGNADIPNATNSLAASAATPVFNSCARQACGHRLSRSDFTFFDEPYSYVSVQRFSVTYSGGACISTGVPMQIDVSAVAVWVSCSVHANALIRWFVFDGEGYIPNEYASGSDSTTFDVRYKVILDVARTSNPPVKVRSVSRS